MTVALGYLLFKGIGIWGNNVPVGWAFDIINFVWWIGIGHAGTLISAILLLFKQDWRTSINRFAEAMTLFAVACAAIFPLIHTGRPWLAAYWLFPYPNTMGLWPNFRSPLIWDVFAVSTYGTVSALFWFVGLIPDLATLRDRAKSKPWKIVYGIFAMAHVDPTRLPPAPRLQTLPAQDLAAVRAEEDRTLTSYGWVDEHAGTVRIPIEDAMGSRR